MEHQSQTQKDIAYVLENIKTFLLEKNKKYGNSALEPCPVFDKILQNPDEDIAVKKILIRAGDKLKRIENNAELCKNDVVDIIGYLTLICVKKGWNNFNEFIE